MHAESLYHILLDTKFKDDFADKLIFDLKN